MTRTEVATYTAAIYIAGDVDTARSAYLRSNCDPSSVAPMTNPMELVERLRDDTRTPPLPIVLEAAAALEAQAAQLAERDKAASMTPIDKAIKALEPFAAIYAAKTAGIGFEQPCTPPEASRPAWGFNHATITWGNFSDAAQALVDLSSLKLEDGDVERFAVAFVTEQSEGEWPDSLIRKDADKLKAAVLAFLGHRGEGR